VRRLAVRGSRSSIGRAAGQPKTVFPSLIHTDRELCLILRDRSEFATVAVPAEGPPSGRRLLIQALDGLDGLNQPSYKRARLLLDRIKRDKGVWWMPWQQEAMKDVVLCDKLGGGENIL
jgi:hypothetical protein